MHGKMEENYFLNKTKRFSSTGKLHTESARSLWFSREGKEPVPDLAWSTQAHAGRPGDSRLGEPLLPRACHQHYCKGNAGSQEPSCRTPCPETPGRREAAGE